MTRRLALISALSIALHATSSHAEAPTSARLSWVRGEGASRCPDAAFVAARVVAHLHGVDPFTAPAAISVEAFVDRDEEGWHARIYDRDAAGALLGARSFDSDDADCEGVAQASALSIALTLNHGMLPPAAPPVTAPPVAAPPATAPPATAPPVIAESRTPAPRPLSPRPRLELSSSARVAIATGFTPAPSALFALHTEGTARGRLRWMAEALTTTATSPDDAATYAFRFFGGRLGACFEAWQSRAVSLEGCAALTAGGIALTVTDAAVNDAATGLWVGASLDAVARFTPLRPLLFEAGVSASTPFVRPRYEDVANRSPDRALVYESPQIAAMAWLGAGVSIR